MIMGRPAIYISPKTVWAMHRCSAWLAASGSDRIWQHWSCNHTGSACQQHTRWPVQQETPPPLTADARSAWGSPYECGIARCIKTHPCCSWGVPLTWSVKYEHAQPPGNSPSRVVRVVPHHDLADLVLNAVLLFKLITLMRWSHESHQLIAAGIFTSWNACYCPGPRFPSAAWGPSGACCSRQPPAAAMDAGGSFGVGTEGGPGAASGAAAGAASVPRAAAAVSSLAPPCALARRAGGVAALLGGDAAAVWFESELTPCCQFKSAALHRIQFTTCWVVPMLYFRSETIVQINEWSKDWAEWWVMLWLVTSSSYLHWKFHFTWKKNSVVSDSSLPKHSLYP